MFVDAAHALQRAGVGCGGVAAGLAGDKRFRHSAS